MPAYRDVKKQLQHFKSVAQITLLEYEVEVFKSILPGTKLHIWLIDCPTLFYRKGNPYIATNGSPWLDNAQRFALFGRVITALASNQVGLNWQPDIVHCNDWQTALAPALLHFEKLRPGIVFTIHNLAYQGIFPRSTYLELQLPDEFWSYESMEFYGQFSFIKGGIVYADQVTTVSPKYATEIQTKEHGSGLESLLKFHSEKLTGVINGINSDEWNPKKDVYIHFPYSRKTLEFKTKNKLALQKELKFKIDENCE